MDLWLSVVSEDWVLCVVSTTVLLIICIYKMFQEPDYFEKEVTLKLSEVLSDIGVNERMVLKRRRIALVKEALINIRNKLNESDQSVYNFGSQSEGTTTIGLKSDSDLLWFRSKYQVIQDRSEWTPNKVSFLMVHDETISPGYCLLQVLKKGEPIPLPIADFEHRVRDKDLAVVSGDKVLLKNKTLQMKVAGTVINGPATSSQGGPGFADSDFVRAYHCQSWPEQARSWTKRQGKGRWPSKEMMKDCQTSGCFIVPVSSKSGLNEETEWRISTSQAERCLMFDLNITQIRCYVLMKMILKNSVCKGIISSYMCKTVLFYCIQNTNCNMWREDNLLACTVCCIKRLKNYVEKENCPHFIIPKNNLMARTFLLGSKQKVLEILQYIIQSPTRFFLGIKTDDLGSRLKIKMKNGVDLEYIESADEMQTNIKSADEMQKIISGQLVYDLAETVSSSHLVLLEESGEIPQNKFRNMIFTNIQTNCGKNVTIYEQSAIKYLTPLLCSTLGSVIASKDIYMYHFLSQEALIWLQYGRDSDVLSGRLKFASSLYCVGDLQSAEKILRCTHENYCLNSVDSMCCCYTFRSYDPGQECMNKCDNGNEEEIKHITSFCVRFLQCEIHCVPKELQYEMFRSTQQERLERNITDFWMDWGVADSLPFLYFLQYKTYDALQRNADKQRALVCLQYMVITNINVSHRETTLNLLGQCMEQENQPIEALRCYVKSLNVRAKNNAAKILLCRLVSELVKK